MELIIHLKNEDTRSIYIAPSEEGNFGFEYEWLIVRDKRGTIAGYHKDEIMYFECAR